MIEDAKACERDIDSNDRRQLPWTEEKGKTHGSSITERSEKVTAFKSRVNDLHDALAHAPLTFVTRFSM